MGYTNLIFHILWVSILLTSSIASIEHVAVIKYSDVQVFTDPLSLTVTRILPLGAYVIYTAADRKEFLRISFPFHGHILVTTVYAISDRLISEAPLWGMMSQLFSAGKGVMGSQTLSLGWVDQWPIGI
jgi:hypothetical protein